MKTYFILNTIILTLLGFHKGYGVTVTMTVEQNQINLNESLMLQVTVEGTREASDPVITHGDSFEIHDGGTSSQIQIINGRTTSSKVFQYMIYPKKAGEFDLGPAQVEVDGKTYSSNIIKIVVSGESKRESQKNSEYFYVKASISDQQPYLGEQIVFTFQFFRRVDVTQAQMSPFEFKGFWIEDLGKQNDYEKVINGIPWSVTEFKKALFPHELGSLTIDPLNLTAQVLVRQKRRGGFFDSFFDDPFFRGMGQSKQVRLKTEPIKIQVQPIPPLTNDFQGLVGKTQLKVALSKNNLMVGESATLTIELSGSSYLRDFVLPPLNWENVKTYDDQPKIESTISGSNLITKKSFKKALVPSKAGEIQLPPFRIDYFDPEKERLATLLSQPITLNISENPNESQLTHVVGSEKSSVKLLGEDIMPIKLSASEINALKLSPIYLIFSAFGLPILSLFGWLYSRRLQRIQSDSGYEKRSQAYKIFLKRVKAISSHHFFEEASMTLRNYLGDKLDFDGKAMASNDVMRKLETFKFSISLQKRVENFIKKCEAGQYGNKEITSSEQNEMMSEMLSLGKEIEKVSS